MNGSNMDGTDAPKKQDPYRKPSVRRPTRRCIFIIVAVLIICLVISIVLGLQLRRKSDDDCPKGLHCNWRSMPHSEFLKDERCDSLCTTRPCIRSAQYILGRMDSSMDPCEDFYAFACGTYEQQTAIFLDHNEGVYTSQEMENEVLLHLKEIIDSIAANPRKSTFALRLGMKLYKDCMETDHNTGVLSKQLWKELFAENGRLPWPLVNENIRNDQKHFVRMMSSTLLYGVNPFFRIGKVEMTKLNKKNALLIRFVESDNIETLKTIYDNANWNLDDKESINTRYLVALGTIITELGVDNDNLKDIVPQIIDVEKRFLDLTTKALEENEKVYENNRHLSYEFRNHSCPDLDHNMGNIKWCELAKQLRKDYGFPPDIPTRIELPALGDYFAAVNTVVGHHLDRDIINYIGVKFMAGLLKYMPSPLREIPYRNEDIFPTNSMRLPLTARWQQCVSIVTEFISPPLEKEYLKRNLDEKTRDKVHKMVEEMKETYLSLVDKMTWLKTTVKGDLKKRVRNIELVIGRVDDLLKVDETAFDKFYSLGFAESEETKAENTPLILGVLQMIEFRERIPLVADIDDTMFSLTRFFSPVTFQGKIEIEYSELVFPMYYPGRPMYAEYANLGSTIALLFTHALLWEVTSENATIQAFRNAAMCLREQSHLYKTESPLYKLNLGREDSKWVFLMIYTMGTQGSFHSYEDHLKRSGEDKGLPGLPFTNEQLFFISAAQAHCEKFTEKGYRNYPGRLVFPARLRVNVPLAHTKEFSEAFRCPADSSMNLKRRCCLLGDGTLSRDCK